MMAKANTRRLPGDCCELGEGPSYERATDTAWWLDIVGRKLIEHRFRAGVTIAHNLPRMASLVARIDDERQLIAMDDGLYQRRRADGALSLLVPLESGNAATRSNDGRVHTSGRLWIGTMGKKAEKHAGSIYWSDGVTVERLYPDITIPNSICFSPDGATACFADTAVNTVWRVAVDPANGRPIGEPERFLSGRELPLGGHFDGSVVDADGVMWNAAWGGGSVSGFAPDGHLVETFEVPAGQTSCPCFVGPDLDRMLVTSAWQGLSPAARDADPGAGHTHVIEGRFRGLADSDFVFRTEGKGDR
ncbi:MAG: SMP-30/gluconolactonase/LRE family protein [Phyllobacteriaceae bacterium]|nr:SMP-30/gluconolactonase/LRE family protein [Phyllobacteriaceae bacterium]